MIIQDCCGTSNDTEKRWLRQYDSAAHDKCVMFYSDGTPWETSDGWNKIVADMSLKIENLNRTFYGKYGLKIVAEQIKQKFGTLSVYYTVVHDPVGLCRIAYYALKGVVDRIREKFDFGYEVVCTEHPSVERTLVIRNNDGDCCGTDDEENTYNVDVDGKKYKVCVHRVGKLGSRTRVPTKHKAIEFLVKKLSSIADFFYFLRTDNNGADYKFSEAYIELMTDEIIRDAVKLASQTCEQCGRTMFDKSSVCTTTDYIGILCPSCAKRTGYNYVMDGKTYLNGEPVNG